MEKNFKGVIWTNHALSRMRDRGIKQGDAWAAFNRPDQSKKARIKGAWVYYKTWTNQKMEVVAKKNERGKWVVLSVWSRQADYKKKKAGKSFARLFLDNLLGRK